MTEYFNPPDAVSLGRLKAIVGDANWRAGADALRYFEDPRGRFAGKGCVVLLPGSTGEVAEILRLCNASRLGIIPFGGGTGVVAGQLSPGSESAIILSLERMNRIREIREQDFAMVVEAGCVLEHVHAAAAGHGLTFPLNMASKGSCTIGGNLATNAGGIQVLRHGNARDLCLGIEAVLPSGEVLHELSPLRKNNTGYDLRHLLIGSEGTLGVITAATLMLKPLDPETVTVLCAIASPGDALRIYHELRNALGETISGLELLSGFGLSLVNRHFPLQKNPFSRDDGWYLLAELSGPAGFRDRAEAAVAACFDLELIQDAVIATSEAQRNSLWQLRENTPDANRRSGAFCNSDTSVPISQIEGFIALTHETVSRIYPGLRVNSYGHIGDGNIHHNVFPPENLTKAEFLAANPQMIDIVRTAINEATERFGGSISAEHGIGRLKLHDLETYGSAGKRAALQHIKSALDPNNIMNPGALVG